MDTDRRWFRNPCPTTDRDRRNQRRIIAWSLAWVACWTVGALALERGWLAGGVAGTAVAALSALLGVATLVAYRRFLRQADELRRVIELEALALAFGVGLVAGFACWLLGKSGIVAEEALLWVLLLMIVAHPVGIVIGFRRYA